MDERAYHLSRQALNVSPCVFEQAILADCARCELARRQALAERDVISCSLDVARINCATLGELFHERATFALRLPRPGAPVPHARALQLQCGGLDGLQKILGAPEKDIHRMLRQAQANGASLLDLNWKEIVSELVAWRSRRAARLKSKSEAPAQ